jgi:hypothetical protein
MLRVDSIRMETLKKLLSEFFVINTTFAGCNENLRFVVFENSRVDKDIVVLSLGNSLDKL